MLEGMLSGRECAAKLGISDKTLCIYAGRDWFPKGRKIGKRFYYQDPPTEQRKAIEQNVRQRKPLKPEATNDGTMGSTGRGGSSQKKGKADRNQKEPELRIIGNAVERPSVVSAEPSQFTDDDPAILALESQAGSAVSISRSILNLASRDLARRFKKGNVGATQLDALNKTLARLVSVEADALKTAERMGLLMHREAVERVVGVLAERFIRAFGRLEAEIATEALLWRQMQDMPAEQYSRRVREFVQKHAREIRAMEAAEIEAITKKEN